MVRHQFELHVRHRRADGVGAVGQDLDLHRLRQVAGQLRQQQLDAVHHGNDVRARLPLDVHDHGRRLVHPRRLADVLGIVDHIGHVRQLHRRAIAIGDDQRLIVGARQQLIVGADLIRLMRCRRNCPWPGSRWPPRWRCARSSRFRPYDASAVGIRLNPHGRLLAAADAHQSHARQLRDLRRQPRIRQIFHLRTAASRRKSAPASESAYPPDSILL